MSKKPIKPETLAATAGSYASWLADIKQRIRTARYALRWREMPACSCFIGRSAACWRSAKRRKAGVRPSCPDWQAIFAMTCLR